VDAILNPCTCTGVPCKVLLLSPTRSALILLCSPYKHVLAQMKPSPPHVLPLAPTCCAGQIRLPIYELTGQHDKQTHWQMRTTWLPVDIYHSYYSLQRQLCLWSYTRVVLFPDCHPHSFLSHTVQTVWLQCVSSALCFSGKIMPQMDKGCMNGCIVWYMNLIK